MRRIARLAVALFASLALVAGVAACGDDDDSAGGTSTSESTTSAPEDGGDGEQGAPDVNPCAEGESGTLGEPGPTPGADATPVTITAADYSFSGYEAMTAVGEYALTFTNEGKELHEVSIVKIDDSETRPLDELLQEEDPSGFITDVAFSFACPGATAEPVAVDLAEPGRYVMICFIPTGATPETDPAEFDSLGAPHFTQGMVHEFQVA